MTMSEPLDYDFDPRGMQVPHAFHRLHALVQDLNRRVEALENPLSLLNDAGELEIRLPDQENTLDCCVRPKTEPSPTRSPRA